MSSYIYHEFIKDFSGRTRQNMNVIDAIYNEHSPDPDKTVYEVTQMINSLFGMIIVPYEKYKYQIEEKDYSDEPSYLEIQQLINEMRRTKSLRSTYTRDTRKVSVISFIGHLRNALAHSGNGMLNFYPVNNKKDNIKAVYFIDKKEKDGTILAQFCCKLSVKRIRKLCELIPQLYMAIEESISKSEREIIDSPYRERENKLERFLKGVDEEIRE